MKEAGWGKIYDILHTISSLLGRERLLQHVGMMGSFEAELAFLCMILYDLLKSLVSELGGQTPAYVSWDLFVIQTI